MSQSEIQTAFTTGEVSPNLYARVDFAKYESGAALIRNFIVDYRGGVTYRPGTQFIDDLTAAGLTGKKRVIPFIVSTEATYILVFSNNLITVYNLGVLVTTVVTPYAAADIALLKYTQSADVLTIVHPSYAPANLSRTAPTVFSYALIVTGPTIQPPTINNITAPHNGPYSFGYLVTSVDIDGKEESLPSAPGVKHSLAMDETKNQVIFLTWNAPAQAVSTYNIYKWGPNDFATTVVGTAWGLIGTSQAAAFTDNNIAPDFSKQPPNWGDPFSGGQLIGLTLTAGGAGYTGAVSDWPTVPFIPLTIVGDGVGAAGYAIVNPVSHEVVGGYITNPGKNYTTATITAIGLSGTGATFDAILADIAPLYPAAVGYIQQRRMFAGALSKPETLIGSQIGLYNNFNKTPISLATDAIVYSLSGEQVNSIRALVPASYGLLVFTTGGSFLINGGSPFAPITPASISAQAQSSVGANDLQPLRVNSDILYVQNKGNRVRNLSFAWQKQSYQGEDISALASHLFDTFTMPEWCWAEEPFKVVWAVRDDGRLLSMTYVPDQEVFAWARHDTQGIFQSVCSVPEGGHDAVYVIVDRYVPLGETDPCLGWRSYLERFDASLSDCVEHSWHLDSAVRLPHNAGYATLTFAAATGPTTMHVCGGQPYLRTNSVSTTDVASPNNELTQFLAWLPLTVPVGFNAGAGDYLTFSFTLNSGTEDTLPDTFSLVADFIPMQVDGGALNAGPYSGSGFSYTNGRQFALFGDMGGSWNTPGEQVFNHDSPGQTEFSTNQFIANVTAGGGGFAGEGVITSSLPETEVAGWNAQREFRQTADTSLPLLSGTNFTLECFLQVVPSDATHPARTMFMELTAASMTWVPFVGDPVTEVLDLTTAKVGFNTGSAGTAPGLFGPYTYRALQTVNNAIPPLSSLQQDLHVVDVAQFGVGDTIIAGCAKVEVLSRNLDGSYHVNIVGELTDFIIPNDPNTAVRPLTADEWTWVTPTEIIGGLDHLIGKEVWALGDGVVYGPIVPTIGAIELPVPVSNGLAGLLYQGQVKTLDLTVDGLQPGTIQGKRKLITGVTARVDNALGLQSGTSFDSLSPIPELIPSILQPVGAFTGDARNLAYADWNVDGVVCIQQDVPLPATLLGIITEVTPGDTGR